MTKSYFLNTRKRIRALKETADSEIRVRKIKKYGWDNCKNIKQPRCPSVGEQKDKPWYCQLMKYSVQFSRSVMSDSLWLPWTAALQPSLSITNSQSLLKLMSIESVMPSNPFILCCRLLPPSIFPSIRVFCSESALCMRWPNYWSVSIRPTNEYSGLISFTDLISLQSKGLSRVFSSTRVQKHQFFCAQPSLWSNSHIHTWLLEKP